MKQDDAARALRSCGHQRCTVGKACPGARRQVGGRLCQHLPLDEDALRARHAGKWAERRIIGKRLRFGPGESATQRALALAQRHRNQRIVGGSGSQTRTRKPHQRPAVFDPFGDRRIGFFRQAADIGHDQHGRLLRQKLGDRDRHIRFVRLDQIRIGGQARG